MKMEPRTNIETTGLARVVEDPPWFAHLGDLPSIAKL